MEIKWSKPALGHLIKILNFKTENDFDTYAQKLEDLIITKTEALVNNPTVYPLDKYKKSNDGSYGAFEIDEYRISYRVRNTEIKIIRIRHTSRKVLNY